MADQINTEEELLERLRQDLQVLADECEGVLIHIHRDELRALLSASQPVAGQGWMPIETAPRDGTFVLLWLRAPYSVADVLRWEASVQGWVSAYWEVRDEGFCGSLVPSHWQPITPPAALSQPSAGTAGGAATNPPQRVAVGAVLLPGISGEEYDDPEVQPYQAVLENLQAQLVRSGKDVTLEMFVEVPVGSLAPSPCAEGERGTANQEGGK